MNSKRGGVKKCGFGLGRREFRLGPAPLLQIDARICATSDSNIPLAGGLLLLLLAPVVLQPSSGSLQLRAPHRTASLPAMAMATALRRLANVHAQQLQRALHHGPPAALASFRLATNVSTLQPPHPPGFIGFLSSAHFLGSCGFFGEVGLGMQFLGFCDLGMHVIFPILGLSGRISGF